METIEIEVPCPDCGDENRDARRRCKKRRGMCGGSGRVVKTIPKPPEPPPPPDRAWARDIARHSPPLGGLHDV